MTFRTQKVQGIPAPVPRVPWFCTSTPFRPRKNRFSKLFRLFSQGPKRTKAFIGCFRVAGPSMHLFFLVGLIGWCKASWNHCGSTMNCQVMQRAAADDQVGALVVVMGWWFMSVVSIASEWNWYLAVDVLKMKKLRLSWMIQLPEQQLQQSAPRVL